MPPKKRQKFTRTKSTRSKAELTSKEHVDETLESKKDVPHSTQTKTDEFDLKKNCTNLENSIQNESLGAGENVSSNTPAIKDDNSGQPPNLDHPERLFIDSNFNMFSSNTLAIKDDNLGRVPPYLDHPECVSIDSEVNVSFETTPVRSTGAAASGFTCDDFNVQSTYSQDGSLEPMNVELLRKACVIIQMFLPNTWICRIHEGGIDVMLLSRKGEAAIQRRLHFTPCGKVTLSVHCQPVDISVFLKEGTNTMPLTQDSLNIFVDRCVKIVEEMRTFEICAGLDDVEYKDVWSSMSTAKIDNNPYQESRYTETLRSNSCARLVLVRRWRCKHCESLRRNVQRRMELFSQEAHSSTRNDFLSDAQKLRKLEEQHKKLHALTQKLQRKEDKIQNLLDTEGINLSEDIGNDLMNILQDSNLSPAQALFLQQQAKASQTQKSGMRWHPDMVRFALALYMQLPSTYETARQSGMIKLPCQRTLYDYSHVYDATEGIDEHVLEEVSNEIGKMGHTYQKYHCLSVDEMHICQNLVFRKATGEMIGYAKLSEVAADIAAMENYLQSSDSTVKPQLASKMLCYMIKGIANNLKEVVAAYSVSNLTTDFLYECTWDVINKCERAGIAIVAFVADGYTVNRAFMKKHKPALVTKSGLIYATINKAVPERSLFFMSDVAHLLKTTRNNLYNSGEGGKSKRCLEKGGQKMTWQPIIDLYNKHKKESLRKAYKLTSENVYINSYSQMKVKHAAAVLSKTVAKCIEDEMGPESRELAKFIRLMNDWFDCLNGAFSTHGTRTRNPNLNPYRLENDSRFKFLEEVLHYLSDWKEEVQGLQAAMNLTESFSGQPEIPYSGNEDNLEIQAEENQPEGDAVGKGVIPAKKKLLSAETMDGIEFTTMSFIDCVKFLLKEGVEYINPRVFSQDHLEQHFCKRL